MDETISNKYKSKLQNLTGTGDAEYTHIIADECLTDMLLELGYKDIVEIYKSIDKWYA